MRLSSLALAFSALLLSGCDAWPTIINNRSHRSISFQYHERGEEDWSAPFSLKAGEAQRLAREHWVQDITGFIVDEGSHRYTINYDALVSVRHACSSSLLSRRLKLAADCYVTYDGAGRLTASIREPPKLVLHDLGNGS